VNARTLVLIKEKNSKDANYHPLSENWERVQDFRLEDGARPEVIPLPMPAPLYYKDWRLLASHANFYISNAAGIVPTFNHPHRCAFSHLRKAVGNENSQGCRLRLHAHSLSLEGESNIRA